MEPSHGDAPPVDAQRHHASERQLYAQAAIQTATQNRPSTTSAFMPNPPPLPAPGWGQVLLLDVMPAAQATRALVLINMVESTNMRRTRLVTILGSDLDPAAAIRASRE